MTACSAARSLSAIEGAFASGFATAELHHPEGHDPGDQRPMAAYLEELVGFSRISTYCHYAHLYGLSICFSTQECFIRCGSVYLVQ